MSELTKDTKGSLYALASGFLYGFIGYFGVSVIHSNFSISTMLFWRFLIASVVIGGMLIYNRDSIKANFLEIVKAFIYGTLFYGGSAFTYFMASDYIGTGLSMVIVFTYPVLVILSNWFFEGLKITKIYYVSITIIMIGMALLVDRTQMSFNIYGIILALVCSVAYAAYVIGSKHQVGSLDPLTSSLVVSISNCIAFLALTLFEGSFTVPQGFGTWVNILGIGILCTALPILFLLEAMKCISSDKASLLSVLEPVCVVTIGMLLLDETLTALQVVGIIAILGGALLVQFEKLGKRIF